MNADILIIGGALNAVFIPQLVRRMKDDADGGQAYADRLITLAGLVLLIFSVAAVLLAPLLVDLYATSAYDDSQRELATAFARLCLPQIFFYGVYALLSQVLNARGKFGAPMFAPIRAPTTVATVRPRPPPDVGPARRDSRDPRPPTPQAGRRRHPGARARSDRADPRAR